MNANRPHFVNLVDVTESPDRPNQINGRKGWACVATCRECGVSCEIHSEHTSTQKRSKEAVSNLARQCNRKPLRIYFPAELPSDVRLVAVSRDLQEFEAWLVNNRVVTLWGEPSIECAILIEIKDEAKESGYGGFQKLGDTLMKLGFKNDRIRVVNLTAKEWAKREQKRIEPKLNGSNVGVSAGDRDRHTRTKAVPV